ncbi:hypothetical protein [Chitinimonas sp.]|uniref:hypothetical protein n=1 Tax=Chitinimonas sp. TaxID=1934313 RepID=UPI0035AF77E2
MTKHTSAEVRKLITAYADLLQQQEQAEPGAVPDDVMADLTRINHWMLNLPIPTTGCSAMCVRMKRVIDSLATTGPKSKSAAVPDGWRELFWEVAKVLKCLPSTFLDGNQHVIRAAENAMLAAAPAAPQQDGALIDEGSKVDRRASASLCYSEDGRIWFDNPTDAYCFIGSNVGDQIELLVSTTSWPVTFVVTKRPGTDSDDYAVEPAIAQKGQQP